jgi:hypothetical protein
LRPSARNVGRRAASAGMIALVVVGGLVTQAEAASPMDPAAARGGRRSGAHCEANETRLDRVRHRFATCSAGRLVWREVIVHYGDSLSSQASPYVRHYFELEDRYLVVDRTLGGTAPCDWLPKLRRDIDRYAPAAVLFQFTGNALGGCMGESRDALLPSEPGVESDPEPYFAQYERDTRRFARIARDRRVPMFIAASPPKSDFHDASSGWGRLDEIYRSVASAERAIYMPEPRLAVANSDGSRVEALPCLAIEPCFGDPVAGHNPLFAADRGHFGCAVPIPAPVRGVTAKCPAHSSGALRYGLAMVSVVRGHLDEEPFRAPRVPRSLTRP